VVTVDAELIAQGLSLQSVRLPDVWSADAFGRRKAPAWARALIAFGAATAAARADNQRLVAALALPTRAYAATLVALGVVTAQAPRSFNPARPTDEQLEDHFRLLCGLRPGSTVTVGKAKLVGTFKGVDESGAEPMLLIQQRSFLQKIPQRMCNQVAAQGRSLSTLLIGRINIFDEEIRGKDLVAADGEPLQTLLKVGRYCRRGDKHVLSDLLATAGELPAGLEAAMPTVTIFDGTASFRHWRETWRQGAWVVVLDRSAQNFDEGVALVESEFVQRGTVTRDEVQFEIPEAAEIMSFWTVR
jgi:hypothetical protein